MPKRQINTINQYIYRDCLAKMQMQKLQLPHAKTEGAFVYQALLRSV